MSDGSKPLENRKWEAFALLVGSKSMSAAAAYRKHWPKASKATAERQGPFLASKHEVSMRIAWLRSEASKRLETQADGVVMSIAEKRAFLAKVVRSVPSEASFDNAACELVITKMGPAAVFPSKLAAMKLDNDLAGEGAEAAANKALEIIIKKL